MKDAAQGTYNAVKAAEQHFEAAARKLVEAFNAPSEDVAKEKIAEAKDEMSQAFSDSADSAAEAARAEVKRRFLNFQDVLDKDAAECFFEQKWKDVLNLDHTIRATAPKVGKWLWLKVAGGLALASAMVAVIIGGHQQGTGAGNFADNISDTARHAEQMRQFYDQMNQYDSFVRALQQPLPSVPEQAQAEAVMPAQIAAVAQAPLAVAIPVPVSPDTNTQETRIVQSTVGQVWQSIPESHKAIEKATGYTPGWMEPKARWPGDYAAPTSKGGSLKVDATVTAPWGATVHIESD